MVLFSNVRFDLIINQMFETRTKPNKTGFKLGWNQFCIQNYDTKPNNLVWFSDDLKITSLVFKNTMPNWFGTCFIWFSDVFCPICPQKCRIFKYKTGSKPVWRRIFEYQTSYFQVVRKPY